MTSPSLLEAARRFLEEHTVPLVGGPVKALGLDAESLAAWASALVEAERERYAAVMPALRAMVEDAEGTYNALKEGRPVVSIGAWGRLGRAKAVIEDFDIAADKDLPMSITGEKP